MRRLWSTLPESIAKFEDILESKSPLKPLLRNSYMAARKEVTEKDLKLELVQVIFRHGARTPVIEELNVYQYNDPCAYETCGLGQLTNHGKKMKYEFGVFLRKRYRDFLSENYKPEEVYAYSTDVIRTKMSLQLVLAGLYPPVDHGVWNPNLPWTPIPYICLPTELDILMKYFDSPRTRKLLSQVYQSEEFRMKLAEFDDFLAFLRVETQTEIGEDLINIVFLCGVILADSRMNLPLPKWYKHEMKDKFLELMGLVFDAFAFTLELKKINIGPLMKTLIENMNLKETHINPRKIYLYSGHETNVALITRSLNIEHCCRYPEFGCGLILEKLRDSKNQVYVRLLAWSCSRSVTPLKIGCHTEFCPIEDFLKIVEPIIPSDSEIDDMLKDISIKQLRSLFFNDSVVKPLN